MELKADRIAFYNNSSFMREFFQPEDQHMGIKTMNATNVDIRKEQKKIYIAIFISLVVCIFAQVLFFLFMSRHALPTDFNARIAFALQANVFVLIWVVIAIGMLSHGRRHSAADICGSAYTPPSPKIAVRVAFLQNTREQAVIAASAYLALATLLPASFLTFIPASVVLFAIGRVAFYIGYSSGAGARAFGMATTMLPTLAGYLWAMWLIVA